MPLISEREEAGTDILSEVITPSIAIDTKKLKTPPISIPRNPCKGEK